MVTSTSTDGRDFEGELLDNSQYFFDWQFEPTNGGNLKWEGSVAWVGGRIEVSTLDAGALLVPSVPGDYNQNGVVDAADYVVWRDELEDGGVGRSDGNQDGEVDAADYDLWKTNFGQAAAGSSLTASATPEPTSVLSLLLGVLPIMIGTAYHGGTTRSHSSPQKRPLRPSVVLTLTSLPRVANDSTTLASASRWFALDRRGRSHFFGRGTKPRHGRRPERPRQRGRHR